MLSQQQLKQAKAFIKALETELTHLRDELSALFDRRYYLELRLKKLRAAQQALYALVDETIEIEEK